MKRKFLPVLLVTAGLFCGCISGCGNTADNSIDNQNVSDIEKQEADSGLGAALSTEQQLALFEENREQWYVAPTNEWICYLGVSDFDDNGRLEITVSREEAGSYVNTQFYMYEINEDGTGLTKINVELGDATRMPDISLNSVINCYKGEDGSFSYAITDCDMSDYSVYEYDNYIMKLENGSLKCTCYASMVCNLADDVAPEKYYDGEGNATDAEIYNNAELEYVKGVCGASCEVYNQVLGFHYYEENADFSQLLQLSLEKFRRMDAAEYEEYTSSLYDSSSASLGMEDIGSLYYTDIDEAYLKNKRWSSFYVSNFETGEESDYINNSYEGSRFEKEVIFFANDGTGYYMDVDGNVVDFTWSVNDVGSAEAVCVGDTYKNSIFGYTLVDTEGIEHQAIAFEYKNEYIYSMCE